jgi:hypothetical protein
MGLNLYIITPSTCYRLALNSVEVTFSERHGSTVPSISADVNFLKVDGRKRLLSLIVDEKNFLLTIELRRKLTEQSNCF